MNFIYQDGLLKKSHNSTNKIMNRYILAILPFLIMTILYNIIIEKNINVLISILITNVVCILTQYIINLIKKDYKFKNTFIINHILILSLILSLFTIHLDNIMVLIVSIITTILKNIFYLNNKAILISIILINIYKLYYLNVELPLANINNLPLYSDITKYASIKEYILGLNIYYLSPLLAIIMFIYLFHKKSIKYIIPISIILTYTFMILIIGIINGLSLWYPLFNIITGNIIFLSIFIATDYFNTPISYESSLIYGILIGIIASILRYIIPEFNLSVSILIVTLLTNFLDKLSFKLKYNRKFYRFIIISLVFLVIITSIGIGIIL